MLFSRKHKISNEYLNAVEDSYERLALHLSNQQKQAIVTKIFDASSGYACAPGLPCVMIDNSTGTSYQGLLYELMQKPIVIKHIKVITTNPKQLQYNLRYVYNSQMGKETKSSISISSHISAGQPNLGVIEIPTPKGITIDSLHYFEYNVLGATDIDLIFFYEYAGQNRKLQQKKGKKQRIKK